eukprot:g78811.t1
MDTQGEEEDVTPFELGRGQDGLVLFWSELDNELAEPASEDEVEDEYEQDEAALEKEMESLRQAIDLSVQIVCRDVVGAWLATKLMQWGWKKAFGVPLPDTVYDIL